MALTRNIKKELTFTRNYKLKLTKNQELLCLSILTGMSNLYNSALDELKAEIELNGKLPKPGVFQKNYAKHRNADPLLQLCTTQASQAVYQKLITSVKNVLEKNRGKIAGQFYKENIPNDLTDKEKEDLKKQLNVNLNKHILLETLKMFKRKDANNLYSTFVFFEGQYDCFYDDEQFAGFIPSHGKIKFKSTPENQMGLLRTFKEGKEFRFVTGRIEVVKKVDGFYASVSCQANREDLPPRTKPYVGSSVGIDFGNKKVMTLSDGKFKEKFSPKVNKRLKTLWARKDALQKCLSRKEDTYRKMNKLSDGVPSSNNYTKLLQKLRNTELDIQRIREFCGHALTNDILDNYETVYVEDIKTAEIMEKDSTMPKKVQKAMKKNISHNSWGQLKDQLVYKGDWRGNKVTLVPARNSTQTCSNCGNILEGDKKIGLKVRKYVCFVCGMEKDRDVNAAINIHNSGNKISAETYIKVTEEI